MNGNTQFPRPVKLATQVAEINEHLVEICQKLSDNPIDDPKLEILIFAFLGLKLRIPDSDSSNDQTFLSPFLGLNAQFPEANGEFLVIELLLVLLFFYRPKGLFGYLSPELRETFEQYREVATLINPEPMEVAR